MLLILKRRWADLLLFIATIVICLCLQLTPVPAISSVAQAPSVQQLVQQGVEHYKTGNYQTAIDLWQQALLQSPTSIDTATIRHNLAQAYQQIGRFDQAIFHREQAIQVYRTQVDSSSQGTLAKLLAEQAQTYSIIGQQEQAEQLLEVALKLARQVQDSFAETAILGSQGRVYGAQGKYDQALAVLQQGIALAQQKNYSTYLTTSLNLQGNILVSRSERYRYQAEVARSEKDTTTEAQYSNLSQKDLDAALEAYRQSIQISQSVGGLAQVRARLNLNQVLQKFIKLDQNKTENFAFFEDNRNQILALLNDADDSQEKAYALINLANTVLPERSTPGAQVKQLPQVEAWLRQAVSITARLGDRRSESFALGTLARLQELQGDRWVAMQLTRQAQQSAQEVNAADSLYQWQWQAGRLLKADGKTTEAIYAYRQAISTLQTIRGNILVASKDLQFDFRDAVEPLYRELIALLLSPNLSEPVAKLDNQVASGQKQLSNNLISEALETFELLKLAELQNFFGDECVRVALEPATSELYTQAGIKALPQLKLESGTVLIYSLVLNEHMAMIVRSPDEAFKVYWIDLSEPQLQAEIDTLRTLLEDRQTEEYLAQAQRMYRFLIQPLQQDLQAFKAKTLVFINDGVLRKVPMAALHDGQKFLVEQYAIANTPSLSLTTHKPSDRSNWKALILGLTVAQPPFSALTNVATEVEKLKNIVPGTQLLDARFTKSAMQQQLEQSSYPLIHMATHGRFGIDADSTFLLAYESRITIQELEALLRSSRNRRPIELLTLSACQTATGDHRSTLGIAGVAVQAGVRSALATLWYINDEATVPLIETFYTQLLKPDMTKAEALRQAQLAMIRNPDLHHPAVWSPFILIGNWL